MTSNTIQAVGAQRADLPLQSMLISRRDPGAHDVQIEISYCGICHSDLHQVRSEWAGTLYPCVPGHEIVGRVSAVGSQVNKFKLGDLVGVGCIVDSCKHCDDCNENLENYCDHMVPTYNGYTTDAPGHTLGGYSQRIVVDEHYVLRISHPQSQLAAVAPLLCAGITTYSPLRHWAIGAEHTIGVIGIGGLGHMAIKLANAMGAQVIAFTTSESKRHAAKTLGAHHAVLSNNLDEMAAYNKRLDFILNTVAAPHDLNPFLSLLKRDGTMVLVGVPATPHPAPHVFNFVGKRRKLAGSMIGGIAQTQEMLDFCAKHNIVADIETITANEINHAYERMLAGNVKYRFVMDCATLAV